MLHEKLAGMQASMSKLASAGTDPVRSILAMEVISTALEPAHHDGLTVMVRPGELVVFETDGSHKDSIQYGGMGAPGNLTIIGGDGPMTFIVGMCIASKVLKVPLEELVEMMIAFAKTVFTGYHEAKGEGR
jgi:hypothetical protein